MAERFYYVSPHCLRPTDIITGYKFGTAFGRLEPCHLKKMTFDKIYLDNGEIFTYSYIFRVKRKENDA